MNKKTGSDFQDAAKTLRLKKWGVHHCVICNYPCGYVFSPDQSHVGYDNGCDCTLSDGLRPCSWEELAEFYNNQRNQEYITEMNEFWRFANE